MHNPKIDPSSIDLNKALEMTLWSDPGWDKREPKRLTYKSNYFPKVIDFEELVKVKAVGVWIGECGVCHQRKPCTALHHDWNRPTEGGAK